LAGVLAEEEDRCPTMDVCRLSAIELARALRRRALSAAEALEAVLDRAERVAGPVNPFAVRLDERAHAAAASADAALARGDGGPLCGVPLTVKDSHWIAGCTAATGSVARADFVPRESSAVVERLEAAGAVVFAKTATPEFCYFGVTESLLNGRTSNPWDLGRTAGGSSGGAAAAVAAMLGPLSLGGDGGGSIRIPAAFCGVVGFKPTFGLVPREPCSAGWKTLVAYGPLARSVADARYMLGAIAGADARDRHSLDVAGLDAPAPAPGDLRVVASEDLGFAPLDDDVRRAFREALDGLVRAGVDVVQDAPGLGSSVAVWGAIAAAEARWAEAYEFEHRRELLTRPVVDFLALGEQITAAQYIGAQMQREPIHRAYADLFARTGASALVTPALGCEAFPHGRTHPATLGDVVIHPESKDWGGLLYDANLAGLPACVVPMGVGDDGLPVALQVLGPRGADGAVLAAAEAIETVLAFDVRPPDPTLDLAAEASP
jgi:Asp-tRNA(Asn)/Glu-tRNA(Gln) amidotransferase A subunit family amidase